MVPSSYHKQLDGPFNTPEIIREAALTDILRLHIYTVCVKTVQVFGGFVLIPVYLKM